MKARPMQTPKTMVRLAAELPLSPPPPNMLQQRRKLTAVAGQSKCQGVHGAESVA